jgi:hypothetical protein
LPGLEHLRTDGELHCHAAGLQNLLAIRDFAEPPSVPTVTEAVLRLDAAVLDAYELPGSVQMRLLKMFNAWSRPLPPPYEKAFMRYFPEHFEEEITLRELLAITADWERTSERKTELIEKKIRQSTTKEELVELERLKFLTEARGEYFAPLSLREVAAFQDEFESTPQ